MLSRRRLALLLRRPFSSPPRPAQIPPPPPPPPTARLDRIVSRLPPRLRTAAARLRRAPASHVVAFLLLHELTAVVPLLGLVGLLHWGGEGYVPLAVGWAADGSGPHLREGMVRCERYFRRKRWFGIGEAAAEAEGEGSHNGEDGAGPGVIHKHASVGARPGAEQEERAGPRVINKRPSVGARPGAEKEDGAGPGEEDQRASVGVGEKKEENDEHEDTREVLRRWSRAEGGYRIVAEVAVAYAITKALLPVRILVSLWATPWLARGLVRAQTVFRSKR